MTMQKLDNRVGARLRREQGLYNPKECAVLCDVNHWTFYKLIEKGAVKKPTHPNGKSMYYTKKDVAKIRTQLKESE